MAELNEPLSERELDVLSQVVQGAANKEIAQTLVISPNTVKVHLRNIYTKLGVSSRTEASIAAVEKGLVMLSGQLPQAAIEEEEDDGEDGDELEALPPDAVSPDGAAVVAPVETLPAAGRHWPVIAVLALLVAGLSLAWPWLAPDNGANPVQPPAAGFEEIQIADSRWFETRPLPQARQGMVLVSTGVDLYQIGGETTDGEPSAEVEIFDTSTRSWTTGVSKPTPVADAGGAELFGEIYVVGGRLADGAPAAAVEAYSPAQDSWRLIAALPRPLWGGLVLSEGGYLYHFGGNSGSGVVSDSYIYDPSANGWRALPPLPAPRMFATGGVLEGRLYVVGGSDGTTDVGDCHVFDPKSLEWGGCAALTEPRSQAGAAVVLNKLYVIGGQTAANYGEQYDPKTDVWQIINMPMLGEEPDPAWPRLGVANVEARIYAVGGRLAGDEVSAAAYVYAPLVYQFFIPSAPGGQPAGEP